MINNSKINGLYSLSTELYEFDIIGNDEYDDTLKRKFPDGFLNFSLILECYPNQNDLNDNHYISFINNLLNELWCKDIPAIVSSDFEDLLDKQGGYKQREVPFPR